MIGMRRDFMLRERENLTAIQKYKDNKPCLDCGVKYRFYQLDFDHVRGEKLFELSNPGRGGWERILREIEKCDLVCANCHRKRTYERKQHLSEKLDVETSLQLSLFA